MKSHKNENSFCSSGMKMAFYIAVPALIGLAIWRCYSNDIAVIWSWLVELFNKRTKIHDIITSYGTLAPLVFILLQAGQIIISPIPGEATGILGGFLFGPWSGLYYSTIGLSLGSWAAFIIARKFRRIIAPWLKKSAKYERLDNLLEHQGIFICFLLFVMPGFPKDLLCYLLGLSRMPWAAFFFMSSVGRIPGTIMLSWQGAAIYSGNIGGFLVLCGFIFAMALPSWIFRERIYEWMDAHKLQDV